MTGNETLHHTDKVSGQEELSPPWLQIYHTLRDEIGSGHFDSGARLPSEKRLCDRFSVTRMTVRRALRALQREGLLTARKGSGVFVRRTPTCYQITDGKRFIENVTAPGDNVSTETLSIDRQAASAELAELLKVTVGATLIIVRRLRLINEEPTFLNFKRLVADRFPEFDSVYSERQSVDDVYRHHGVAAYRRVETRVSGGFASQEEATILGLSVGEPLIRSKTLNEDHQGIPIEYSDGCWPLTAVEFVFPGVTNQHPSGREGSDPHE